MKASAGWSDPDGDSLVFQFSYTTATGTSPKYFSYSPQADNTFTTQLPTGKRKLSLFTGEKVL